MNMGMALLLHDVVQQRYPEWVAPKIEVMMRRSEGDLKMI